MMKSSSINRFKKSVKSYENKHHILAALIIGSSIVLFWRGVWILADFYLFPGQDFLSAILSILIGFVVLYLRDFDLKELLN
ncbi:MAG: hypothetical protein V1660_00205 [archaeon]